jgi:hypothetical protein
MKFLTHLWRRFTGISEPSASVEAQVAGIDELLVRFLTSSSHFAKTRSLVKSAAFLPASDGTVSVFAIDGLPDSATWEIGDRVVAAPSGRKVKGRADFESGVVHQPLAIEVDNDPPRHRAITGWPSEESERQQLALELANAARLILRVPPSADPAH